MGSVSSPGKTSKDDRVPRITAAKAVEEILNQIASRARTFTNADGAAIALRDGDSMLTRASAGGIAPDLGSRLRTEGSFSGLCLKQGRALHCEDTQNDTRVDAEACRALNTRSFIVVPIAGEKGFIGVLAVFSCSARSFTRTDVAVLKTMADQVSQALGIKPEKQSGPEDRDESSAPDPPRSIELRGKNEGSSESLPEIPKQVDAPKPTTEESDDSHRRNTGQLGTTTQLRPAAPGSDRSATQQIELVPLAEAIERVQPSGKPVVDDPLPSLRVHARTWNRNERRHRKSRRKLLASAAFVLIVAAAAAWAFWRSRAVMANPAKESVVVAPSNPVGQIVPLQDTAVPAATPAPTTDTVTPVAIEPSVGLKRIPRTESTAAANPIIVTRSAPKQDPESTSNTQAPQLAFATSKPAFPDSPTVLPAGPRLVRHQLVPSELIHKVAPRYPTGIEHRSGETVLLHATVLKDGSIGEIKVIRGAPPFAGAAIAAVRQWKYKPARMNDIPVESTVDVTVKFDWRM